MKTKNIRQRARFIWSNITILNENIEQFINQDIFHHDVSERNSNSKKGTFKYTWLFIQYKH